MPTLQIESRISTEQLLQAIEQMPNQQLDAFVKSVLALHSRREAPCISPEEHDLLDKINNLVPFAQRQRFRELVAKRRAETLTSEEYEELVQLNDKIEISDAERIAMLIEFAQKQGTSLSELMSKLNLKAPDYE